MYDERHEDHHLPLELGMTAFTLRDGLLKSLHSFINPGEVPQGNKHLAFKHSQSLECIISDSFFFFNYFMRVIIVKSGRNCVFYHKSIVTDIVIFMTS